MGVGQRRLLLVEVGRGEGGRLRFPNNVGSGFHCLRSLCGAGGRKGGEGDVDVEGPVSVGELSS